MIAEKAKNNVDNYENSIVSLSTKIEKHTLIYANVNNFRLWLTKNLFLLDLFAKITITKQIRFNPI